MAIPNNTGGLTWLNTTETYDAGELRRADGALVAGGSGQPWGGIARHSDTAMNVTVNGSDVVTVNPGSVIIPGNAVAETGVYRGSLSAAISGSLAARNATNPRITLVTFEARDTDVVVGHAAYTGRINFVDGTPGAVPAAPALPSMSVELARITVPQTGGGAATVDQTFRTYATAAGGTLIVPTLARLPASAAKFQRSVCLDTGVERVFDGSAWGIDEAMVHAASGQLLDSATSAPSNPAGLKILTSKVGLTFVAGIAGVTFPGSGFTNGLLAFHATTISGATQNPVINAGSITKTSASLVIPGLNGSATISYMAIGY